MLFQKLTVGVMGVNCYILGEPTECMVVDPGGNAEKICSYLDEQGLTVKYIVLTHCHFDHILAVDEVKRRTGAKIVACSKEQGNLENTSINMTGRFSRVPINLQADLFVSEDDTLTSGEYIFRVIETPGHTSGSMCLYCETEKMLLSGDTLFAESVGRADLPTGDGEMLVASIRTKLFPLPDDTRVFPGHEAETTIGHEKKHNPFL